MARILIVNKYFAPDIGGVETVVEQYANWLAQSGETDVVILCCAKEPALRTRFETYKGLKVVRCSGFGNKMGMPLSISFFFWFAYFALRAHVVNIHYPFPLADFAMALTPKRGKLIYTIHANILGKGRIGEIVKWLGLFGLRKADRLAVTSEPLSKSFFTDLAVPRTALPLCLSDTLANVVPSQTLPFELPPRYALFFGRLSKYKGVEVLIEAAKLRHATELPIVIVGHGELADTITEHLAAPDAPHNVFFHAHISSEAEKAHLLSGAEILLFPSTTQAEAFGIVQLEAMVRGTPVLNTHLGTGVEWVSQHHVSGLTVPPNDAQALARAIDTIATDPGLRQTLSQGAQRRARAFSETHVKSRVLEILEPLDPDAPAPQFQE